MVGRVGQGVGVLRGWPTVLTDCRLRAIGGGVEQPSAAIGVSASAMPDCLPRTISALLSPPEMKTQDGAEMEIF